MSPKFQQNRHKSTNRYSTTQYHPYLLWKSCLIGSWIKYCEVVISWVAQLHSCEVIFTRILSWSASSERSIDLCLFVYHAHLLRDSPLTTAPCSELSSGERCMTALRGGVQMRGGCRRRLIWGVVRYTPPRSWSRSLLRLTHSLSYRSLMTNVTRSTRWLLSSNDNTIYTIYSYTLVTVRF